MDFQLGQPFGEDLPVGLGIGMVDKKSMMRLHGIPLLYIPGWKKKSIDLTNIPDPNKMGYFRISSRLPKEDNR
jgi:hypothetical protein